MALNKSRCIGGSQHRNMVACPGMWFSTPHGEEYIFKLLALPNGTRENFWILNTLPFHQAAQIAYEHNMLNQRHN